MNNEYKYITLSNNEFSKIISDFWNTDYNCFNYYKKVKNDILIELFNDKLYSKTGDFIDNIIIMCYYWKDDNIKEIFDLKLEPAMMHKLTIKDIKNKLFQKFGNNYNFQYKFIFYKDRPFLKETKIILQKKKLNMKDII